MVPFVLARGVPVDQADGQLFPVAAALERDVANTVADNFVLADQLVGAVFKDKAMVGGHAGHVRLEGERSLGAGSLRGSGKEQNG